MVRVWFGNESDGLKRDRQDYVITLERQCHDIDAAKRFYCEGLGFQVMGVANRADTRHVFLSHAHTPSFAIALIWTKDAPPGKQGSDTQLLDLGSWSESEWAEQTARLAELGFGATASKTAISHQKWAEFLDPDGYPIRLTYTRPPVTQSRQDPD